MGRKKQYDRQDIIEKATKHFHENGFNYSNTKEIVEAVGINKFSLYSEFSSNKELFLHCLEFYNENYFSKNFELIEKESSNIKDIIAFFKWLPKKSKSPKRYGCLMCNTATEFSDKDNDVTPYLNKYFKRIQSSFKNALKNSVESGVVSKKMDINSLSNYLTTTVIGIMVSNRAHLPIKQIADTSKNVVVFLEQILLKN